MYEASRYNSITGTYAKREGERVCVCDVNVVQSVHGSIGKLTFLHYITISNFGELNVPMCSTLPNIPFILLSIPPFTRVGGMISMGFVDF